MTTPAPAPSQRLPYGLAVAAGVVVWLGITWISHRREAWDSGLYWKYGMPLLIAVSGVLGYKYPRRPWRWPLTAFAAQAAVLFAMNPTGNLMPLGIIAFLVVSLPCVLAAWVGSLFHRRPPPEA